RIEHIISAAAFDAALSGANRNRVAVLRADDPLGRHQPQAASWPHLADRHGPELTGVRWLDQEPRRRLGKIDRVALAAGIRPQVENEAVLDDVDAGVDDHAVALPPPLYALDRVEVIAAARERDDDLRRRMRDRIFVDAKGYDARAGV